MASPFSGRAGRLAGIRGTELAVGHFNAGNDLINLGKTQALDFLDQGRTDGLAAINGGVAAARPEYEGAIARLDPWTSAGTTALGTLQNSLGLGGQGAYDGALDTYMSSPQARKEIDEASDAVARSASATGALGSGNTLRAIADRASDLTSRRIGGWQDRLQGLSDRGQSAATTQAGFQRGLGDLTAQGGRDLANIYTGTAGQEASAVQGFTGQSLGNLGRMSESVIGSETGAMLAGQTAAQNRLNFGTSLLSLGAGLGGAYLGGMKRAA